MEKHILSKSTYIKGQQCLKQLYLHKKSPKLRDRMPAERIAIFSRGTKVGIYAQELFPGGIDAGPKHYTQYQKAVLKTKELMDNGQQVIYEATFQANKTLILLDILVKNGDKWDAYEVKSSVKLSETYYKDAALQYNVLIESGIDINTFSLVHIDKEYVRQGDINNSKLFIITDVTKDVKSNLDSVKEKITEELHILESDTPPEIAIGKHCFAPYDCDFVGHCWKSVKRPSIFDIPSIEFDEQLELYNEFRSLDNILENYEELDEDQISEVNSQINKKEHLELSEDTLEEFEDLYNAGSDIYALKTLSFTPAMPLYDGCKPYQKIAFAYAMMPIDGSAAPTLYISSGKISPNNEIINALESTDESIEFFTYNNRIEEINTFDLQSIIDNGEYYHPAMSKDYSNKSLSKALGIRPVWKSIESDIVAAQYYDEILRGHKNSQQKLEDIKNYLVKELQLVKQFYEHISQ